MFSLDLATWKYLSTPPEAWGESTTIVLVLRAFKRVKTQVCQCSPLQVEEMRADTGYVTVSNTREEGNYKNKQRYEREKGGYRV